MTRVKVAFEGRVPLPRRLRDRLAVKLMFSGHHDAARLVLRLTGARATQ